MRRKNIFDYLAQAGGRFGRSITNTGFTLAIRRAKPPQNEWPGPALLLADTSIAQPSFGYEFVV